MKLAQIFYDYRKVYGNIYQNHKFKQYVCAIQIDLFYSTNVTVWLITSVTGPDT